MKLIARLNVLLAVALSAEAFVVQTSSTLATRSIIASVNPTTTIELQSYGSRQPSALWMSNENEENVDTEARTEAPDSEGEEAPTEEQEPQEDPEIVAIKEEIAQLESTLKEKRRELAYVSDKAEEYSKGGYARKVAEMENMRRARSVSAQSCLPHGASKLCECNLVIQRRKTHACNHTNFCLFLLDVGVFE